MILPITLTIAAAAALLNIWLTIRVGRVRTSQKVMTGDGGNPVVLGRMRAHANFIENTPIVLILLGAIELAKGPQTWLWLVAIVYILARIAHPFGMDRPVQNPLRTGGSAISVIVMIGLAGYALSIPYMSKPAPAVTHIVG